MGITRTSSPVPQPCFGLFQCNDKWHQVKVVRAITESGGVWKNLVQLPDGTELEIVNSLLDFSERRKHFIGHPDAPVEKTSQVV